MNKALRNDGSAASTSVEFVSWNMRLAKCHAKEVTSRTVVVDVAHVHPGIFVDYGVVELLTSRLPSHIDITMLFMRLRMDCDVQPVVSSTMFWLWSCGIRLRVSLHGHFTLLCHPCTISTNQTYFMHSRGGCKPLLIEACASCCALQAALVQRPWKALVDLTAKHPNIGL